MTTKQYLRFLPCSVFGIVASPNAKILELDRNIKGNIVAVPACENVFLWNLQTKEKFMVLNGESSYVSCLVPDQVGKNLFVGYGDGTIHIFDLRTGSCSVSFCGHKSAVSCLAYDEEGCNLASGGKDSEIVVWNVIDQAGLFRLKGHKGPITKCHFLRKGNILISSSKDTYIKFWDLDTQHCFQTLVGNRNEVTDFIVIKDTRLITAVNGPDLRVWDLLLTKDVQDFEQERAKKLRLEVPDNEDLNESSLNAERKEAMEHEINETLKYIEKGKLLTVGNTTVSLHVDRTERIFGCHAGTKTLQLFKILSGEEIEKKFRKRKRKEMRSRVEGEENDINVALVDEFEPLESIQTSGKIHSFSIIVQRTITQISILLKNNSIIQYQLDLESKDADMVHSILLPGHRSIVRTLSYSTDSLSVLSASDESLKIWKSFQGEQMCTHTLDCDSALCSIFVTGNSHCIIGTKKGKLEIFDINARDLLESVKAHDGSVNSACISPDQFGIASGGSDKDVKFWNFELVMDELYSETKKRLSLSLKRTLKMPADVLCLKYSPDNKKIAIALLDFTVQVLFVDSLKLIFSLYGHALPVTCMDISYDGTLIVTGSEDKDIRIWSMEFGSCNKFIKKAHDEGITCMQFLPKTHMFFTGGRDHAIKQWDADNFQKIITLKGHQGEVIAMAVSPDGRSLVTASKDKSVRTWEKSMEPLVLGEQQEEEREQENEVEDLPVIPGEVNKEVSLAGMKSIETIKTVDQLIEAIDIYKAEILKLQEHKLECKRSEKELPLPALHPLLVAFSTTCPVKYMQKVVKKVKSSELEGTLLYLPFNYVLDFLKILCEFVDRGWETELCERCVSFLVRIHLGQILSTRNFQPVVEKLKEKLFSQVYHTRDMIGFAKVSCQLQQQAIDAKEEVPVFTNILDGLQQKKKRSRKKVQRPLVAFS